MTTKELAVYLSLTGEERRKFDAARARRMEEMEREEQIDLAIARLSRMGLSITWTAVFDILCRGWARCEWTI